MATALGCTWVGAVPVESNSVYEFDDCHNSVNIHVSVYGGERREGFYFVEGFGDIQAIKHSVWESNRLTDIMPYKDGREYNIVGLLPNNHLSRLPNYYFQSLDKYKQEIEFMYYVYQLVDPRTSTPFYIGKGKGNRAQTHLSSNASTPNVYKENKMHAIREAGYEPRIEYIAENILDESLAYEIESSIIKRLGRKGYEEFGILTNICSDNRPPSHKGKTYEEIYGEVKASEQREMRSRLQKERGGYGPKQHSDETRKLFSKLNSGQGNPMYGKNHSDDAKARIGKSNSKYSGKLNKKSKCYILTSPDGTCVELWGGEAKKFCAEHDLSWSTLKMQSQKNWGVPKKGKTAGWKLEERKNQC